MSLRRFIIKLRVLVTLLVVLSTVALVGGLGYLHDKGFSDEATQRISAEMERYGIYAEFDNLSLHLIRGLTANNVRFYQSEKREVQIAELPALAIQVDKTKMMRGKLKINTIAVTDATLDIPLEKNNPAAPIIHISEVNGSIDLSGKQSLNTTDLSGLYQGVKVALNCNLWRDTPSKKKKLKPLSPEQLQRYTNFLDHLSHWQWSPDAPPLLTITVEGNVSTPQKIDISFELKADALSYDNYEFESVYLEGDFSRNLVTLDSLSFKNQGGSLQAIADYDICNRNGRFELHSSIDPKQLCHQLFSKHILKNCNATGGITLAADGRFQLVNAQHPTFSLEMTGKADAEHFSFKGCHMQRLSTDFSWNNGDLFLDNLAVQHEQGTLNGRMIMQDRKIRYAAQATLPAEVYFPFIKNKRLVKSLSQFSFNSRSKILVNAKGFINQDNLKEWTSYGNAVVENFSYNGVAAQKASTDYIMDRSSATFSNLRGTFDYSNYPLKKQFNGPSYGSFSAQKLAFDWPKKTVDIQRLRGSIWPAPVLRLFATSIADHLEDYRFHSPPTTTASGRICWAKGAKNNTKFRVGFTTNSNTSYRFLGEDILLSKLKAQVSVLPNKVQVNKLSARAFGGPLSGYLHVTPSNSAYSGRFQWEKLRLSGISKVYGFDGMDAGSLTGSFKFRGKGNDVTTLNGHGNIALANGDLFAVPLFGPLSSLVNGVLSPLSKQKLLHEQAKDFSCNFSAKNGTIHTRDLSSVTPSTTFAGEGWINLDKQTLDLTIRMNFRGLMGLAEVPMKVLELPFQALKTVFTGKQVRGLRQFRGSGKISDPRWQFTPFVAPREGKDAPIFRKPPKARIIR